MLLGEIKLIYFFFIKYFYKEIMMFGVRRVAWKGKGVLESATALRDEGVSAAEPVVGRENGYG